MKYFMKLGRNPVTIALPATGLKHLEGAPLRVALAQVRFAPVHAIEKRDRVADFQEQLASSYVARDPQIPQTLTIQFGPLPTPPAPAMFAPELVWPFEDRERGWSVSLSSSSLALQASAYDDFDDFLAEFQSVLSALIATFDPRECSRLGLRYINEIADERLREAQGLLVLLRRHLVSPVGSELGSDLLGSLCELRFREALGTLVLRHGLIRNDTYLLDYDYFKEGSDEFNGEIVMKTIESFHDVIERLFVWCLSDTYLSELKGRKHGCGRA
jgi:uncharacterized protein (TIGR04255 family)